MTTPPATEERIELRGPSGRLLGVLVGGCVLEVRPGRHEVERIDLRPYLVAAGVCEDASEAPPVGACKPVLY